VSNRRGQGEGSVYQRSYDKKWVGVVDLGYREDGRRARRYVYGRTRKEAHEKLGEAQRAATAGVSTTSKRLTVSAWLADWLEEARPTIRPATYVSYASIVRTHLTPALGRIPVARLTVSEVSAMLRAKSALGLSPRRVQLIRATLRRSLSRAIEHGLVTTNVAARAAGPRQEPHVIQPYEPAEARAFLEAAKGHRFEAAFVTALMTGLRSGELRGLEWGDVSLETRTLTVRRALQRIDGKWDRVEPKSRAGRRVVPLPPMVAEILAWHRIAQDRDRELLGPDWIGSPFDLVFTTSIGTPIDDSNIGRAFQALTASAGLRRVRLHDLRHSAATFWLAAKIPARVVADMLGHSQVGLTLQVYSHVLPELRQDAADAMQTILSPRPVPVEEGA
jgi:integrase